MNALLTRLLSAWAPKPGFHSNASLSARLRDTNSIYSFRKPLKTQARFSFKRNRIALLTLRRPKRKPQETQALALASSQSWLPLLRPNIPLGWRLRLLQAPANRNARSDGRSSGNHDWLLANASDCVWMKTGLESSTAFWSCRYC